MIPPTRRQKRRVAALSGIEVLWVMLWLFCGGVGANLLYHRWGIAGGVLGFATEVAVPFGTPYLLNELQDWWVPPHPPCTCGAQGEQSFQYEGWRENSVIYFCCQCGRRYLKAGRCVRQIIGAGVFAPYKLHKLFGRWQAGTRRQNGDI